MSNYIYWILVIISFFIGIVSSFFSERQQSLEVTHVVQSVIDTCLRPELDRGLRVSCLRRFLEPSVKRYGIHTVLTEFKNIMISGLSINQAAIPHCHDVAHIIGKIGALYSGDPKKPLAECTRLCGDGCYHGVVEGYLSQGKNIQQTIDELCPPENPSCFHGLGHGIASTTGDTRKSLELCDRINNNPSGQSQCGYGVLMELYESSTFEHAQIPLPDDSIGFCKTLWDPYIDICLSKSGIHEYLRTKDWSAAGKTCLAVTDSNTCFSLLGVLVYWQFQNSPLDLWNACRKTGDAHACVGGVIEESVNIDPKARTGFELCGIIPSEDQSICFRKLLSAFIHTYGLVETRNVVSDHCNQDQTDPIVFSSCSNGLGRALFVSEYQNQDRYLTHALSECDQFSQDSIKKSCHNGVLREWKVGPLETENKQIVANLPKTDDFYGSCETIVDELRPQCYFWQVQLWGKVVAQDEAELGEYCARVASERSRQECFGGIGRLISEKKRFSASTAQALCLLMPTDEGRAFCVIEAMRALLLQKTTDAPKICLSLKEHYQSICQSAGTRFACNVLRECSSKDHDIVWTKNVGIRPIQYNSTQEEKSEFDGLIDRFALVTDTLTVGSYCELIPRIAQVAPTTEIQLYNADRKEHRISVHERVFPLKTEQSRQVSLPQKGTYGVSCDGRLSGYILISE